MVGKKVGVPSAFLALVTIQSNHTHEDLIFAARLQRLTPRPPRSWKSTGGRERFRGGPAPDWAGAQLALLHRPADAVPHRRRARPLSRLRGPGNWRARPRSRTHPKSTRLYSTPTRIS